MMKNKMIIGILLLSMVYSCKESYLEIKPDQSLVVPTKLSDMQQLLDNTTIMSDAPGLSMLSADDYMIYTNGTLASLTLQERNAYLWKDDIFEGTGNAADWNKCYEQVFYSNVVLEGLGKIEIQDANRSQWNSLRGSALFYRSMAFYMLVGQFAKAYDPQTASTSLGIPLKLLADVNERPGRGTVKQVYERILTDLEEASVLLLDQQDVQLLRPSRLAVFALLARINLVMGDYIKAEKYADDVIKEKSTLLDFNTLSKTSTRPISFARASETEVIYWQWMINYRFGGSAAVSISPDIVESYQSGDLRRTIFLRDRGNGIFTFKGNYSGVSSLFTGLATSEMFLIRAECRARLNDVEGALLDLNTLMKKRWDESVPYPEFSASDSEEALRLILAERQKELITRGQRWTDLKRLNLDDKFAKVLHRNLEGVTYELLPNDKRYVFPIPDEEVSLSGIEQNER